MLKNDVTEKDRELVRKHWKTKAVFIHGISSNLRES